MQSLFRLSAICSNASVLLLLVLLVSAGCEDRTFASRMRCHSLATVVDELGQPQTTTSFPVSPSLYEYQMGVPRHLSQAELAAHVVVKEVCWPGLLSTHYVWFIKRDKQWVAVNALDWPRGHRY